MGAGRATFPLAIYGMFVGIWLVLIGFTLGLMVASVGYHLVSRSPHRVAAKLSREHPQDISETPTSVQTFSEAA